MKRILLRSVLLLFCIAAMYSRSQAGAPLPTAFPFNASILSFFDTAYSVADIKVNSKICACQVLNVNSKNQRNLRIAVLVEKTSGESASDLALIRAMFDKEKRYMKYFFYDEMKMIGNMMAPTDC
ncbi:MAG: hypothetical protein ABI687_13185, partial [Flavitalea sp.]